MRSKRDEPAAPPIQPWIVVWRAPHREGISASHEGACNRTPGEALDEVEGMLTAEEYAVSAYNQAQCLRMQDSLIRSNPHAPLGQKAFVVFYDLVLKTWGTRPADDRTGEGWLVVYAADDSDAITVAQNRMEGTCIAFLAYDLDEIEEIAWALSASWPEP